MHIDIYNHISIYNQCKKKKKKKKKKINYDKL